MLLDYDSVFDDSVPSEDTSLSIKEFYVQHNKLRHDKGKVKEEDLLRFNLNSERNNDYSDFKAYKYKKLIDKSNSVCSNIKDNDTQARKQSEVFSLKSKYSSKLSKVWIKDANKMDSADILKLISKKSKDQVCLESQKK